jgi:hypothetical protein
MTKEQFRRRLFLDAHGANAADKLVGLCVMVQKEFGELDSEKVLQMPSTRFDVIVEELVEMNRRNSGKGNAPQTLGMG